MKNPFSRKPRREAREHTLQESVPEATKQEPVIHYLFPVDEEKGAVIDDLMCRIKYVRGMSVEYIPVNDLGDVVELAVRAREDGFPLSARVNEDADVSSDIFRATEAVLCGESIKDHMGSMAVRMTCIRIEPQEFIDQIAREQSRS